MCHLWSFSCNKLWQHTHSDRQRNVGRPRKRWRVLYSYWFIPCCCWRTDAIFSASLTCTSLCVRAGFHYIVYNAPSITIFSITVFAPGQQAMLRTVKSNTPPSFSGCGCLVFNQHSAAEACDHPCTVWFLCGILKTGTGSDEQGTAFQLPKQTIPATGATWWCTCQQWYCAASVAN